jgi:hypothetical protein
MLLVLEPARVRVVRVNNGGELRHHGLLRVAMGRREQFVLSRRLGHEVSAGTVRAHLAFGLEHLARAAFELLDVERLGLRQEAGGRGTRLGHPTSLEIPQGRKELGNA